MSNESFLKSKNAKYHHCSWSWGYISRKTDGYIIPYAGKYGVGYVWHKPSWHSTLYHYITYYIIEQKK